MITRYLSLFTLTIAHQYYGDVPCNDFDFVLANHSRRAMAGVSLLARAQEGRLYMMFEADTGGSPMQDIGEMELLIGLRLRNPYFEYFTDPIPKPVPFYSNSTAAKTLDAPQPCNLVAHRFIPVAATDARPLTITVFRMRDGLQMWQGTIQDGESIPGIDMHTWDAGCYRVTQQSGAEIHEQPLVLAPDLATAGVWGIVRIAVAPDFWSVPAHSTEPQPPGFQIGFQAITEKLDYYVVAPKTWSQAFNHLLINDTFQDSSLTFEKLSQTDIPNDGISPGLLGVPDESHAVLFRSASAVMRSAVPAHHLQLQRSGNTLIKNLPLPSADMSTARFIVHISKP